MTKLLFRDSVNKDELSAAAQTVVRLLERYAQEHPAARDLLVRSKNLLERAIRREITESLHRGYLPPEIWEDGELGALDDLTNAVSRFNLLLRGAASGQAINDTVDEIRQMAKSDRAAIAKKLLDKKRES